MCLPFCMEIRMKTICRRMSDTIFSCGFFKQLLRRTAKSPLLTKLARQLGSDECAPGKSENEKKNNTNERKPEKMRNQRNDPGNNGNNRNKEIRNDILPRHFMMHKIHASASLKKETAYSSFAKRAGLSEIVAIYAVPAYQSYL